MIGRDTIHTIMFYERCGLLNCCNLKYAPFYKIPQVGIQYKENLLEKIVSGLTLGGSWTWVWTANFSRH